MALLEGLSEDVLKTVAENLPIARGASPYEGPEILRIQDRYFVGRVHLGSITKRIGIDYVHANELEIIDGKLTGKYLGDIVDGPKKASYKPLPKKRGYQPNYCRGDGANDCLC
jgi:phosphoserine phosphatase